MSKFFKTALWLFTGLALIVYATEPVSTRAQLVVSLSAICVMYLIRTLKLGGFWRHVFLALGTAVVMRYFFWRTINTLPPANDLWNFIPAITLYIAEVYTTIMLAISLFVVADPLERRPAPRLSDAEKPTVDIFIPTYNEDPELVAMTAVAALDIEYDKSKLKVFILDDGGTDAKCNQKDASKAREAQERRARLKELAADLGVTYLTRARNEHAKAGNLNSGLAKSTGDLVVVFDADHVPTQDFLNETVGHFREDPRLFLCQTPHFFSNPDPLEKNLGTFKKMPSENEMFYGTIQKGLDKWNAAFFCGSAAVLRRKALTEVGGFSGVTITEDCETALDLHSRGWTSRYVDKPMICGLQPETFASFIGQRSRWSRGMFQIFLLKNPLFKRGLSFGQKICYLSNMSYWFFPIFRLPFLFAPLLYIWFSMQIYIANTQEFISYTVLYMIANMMTQSYLYGKVRWTWVSELYEYVQSIYLSRGLLTVILNPRKPTFNVTDKNLSLDNDHMSELALPYFLLFGLFAVSMAACVWRYFTEADANELLVVVGMWNLFNLVLSGAALGVVSERRTTRVDVEREAEIAIGSVITAATIVDISYGGCAIRVPSSSLVQPLRQGVAAILNVPLRRIRKDQQTLPVVVSNWREEYGQTRIGFSFPKLTLRHYQAIADLTYASGQDLADFRSSRRSGRGILAGMALLLSWGVTEPVRAITLAFQERKSRRGPGEHEPSIVDLAHRAPEVPSGRPDLQFPLAVNQ